MSPSTRAPLQLHGATVLITGAARGIGAACAERMHARGANVALVGLEGERMEATAARLGERTAVFEADVTDLAALRSAVEGTVGRFGRIDVAIANAGVAFEGALASSPVEHVERTLAVNLLGVWRTDRAVVDEIVRSRGYLLNISSLSAVAHLPLMGPYTAAKAGVEAMSDALRMELAPQGAVVGCAYFGFIDTDLVRASYARPSASLMNANTPAFLREPAPLSRAIDAIERGVQTRAHRLWYPRWVGPAIAMRGVIQPLIELRSRSEQARLAEAIRLADPAGGHAAQEDPLLGVAAEAIR